jgi:hypothetical protein
MATPLTRSDLMGLEQYAEQRDEFRRKVIAHKKHRRVGIGPHLFLYFEDRLTIQYQIQEMLRIEKIFEAEGIQEELDTYNPLIPDGSNLKATAMLEYQDVAERKQQLALLRGVEDLVWLLERSNEEKTSAVHFMRFELEPGMKTALRDGATLTVGSSHESYIYKNTLPDDNRLALLEDLD